MAKKDATQLLKNTALNKIRELFRSSAEHYDLREGSSMEQRSYEVKQILKDLEQDLHNVNKKYDETTKS